MASLRETKRLLCAPMGLREAGTALALLVSMTPWRLERERPSEWLRWLNEEPTGFDILMRHAGGLARAAYRIASARCRAQGSGDMPTLRELQAAALTLGERLGIVDSLPITSLLASDCEEQGLPVIRPLPPPPRKPSAPYLRRAS